ncbi:MAG: hydrogenase expression/formation protein HypE [Armatimonadota bacterium]|nr:MAG: hydrogenase expression/formation protein HypE [Armatimonadota bacterium]
MSEERVLLAHGDGGELMGELVERVFVSRLGTGEPPGDDSARLEGRGELVFTTDAFVVDPIFFPGGDIGKLAVCGTVNDLAAAGARPLALSASFILEEGLLISDLERVVNSMARAAEEAQVRVICGDTKVVPRGSADRVYISTSGVGALPEGVDTSGAGAKAGDVVLVSGPVGDHGLAVLSRREGLEFESEIVSDCAPLAGMVGELLRATPGVHALRDPTRGGLATALNEIARQSRVEIEIEESAVPVRESVAAACELLGLDALYAANEGKMIVVVEEARAESALRALRSHALGREAAIIGRVVDGEKGRVLMKTALGTRRILDRHVGEQMPRIC